ncbi:metalloendopeptidase [Batrachochytrium dendrobatidis]|nr:metalloendopeptidase [Batrachochytrium dendrobatidis]
MVSNQIQLDPLAHLMALLPQLLTRTFSSIGRQATTIQSIVKISNKLVSQPVSQSVGQLASPISQRSLVSSVQFRSQYQSKPSRRITKNTTLVSPITASDGYQRFKNGHPRIYPSKRFYLLIGGCIVLFSVYYYEHLETVPISGRRRFNDVSPGMERLIGNQTYEAVMHEYRHAILPAYHPQSVFVRRIAGRLIKASGLASPDWEVFVINDPQTNAFVLPNGKIFVFSGIIPIAMNEDGIATILGHEIAHHVARHSAEKLAWGKLLLIPQILITLFLGPDYGSLFRGMIMELAILVMCFADQVFQTLLHLYVDSNCMFSDRFQENASPRPIILDSRSCPKHAIIRVQPFNFGRYGLQYFDWHDVYVCCTHH